MTPAVLIRLRPLGPWRYGPGDGGASRIDMLFRSDRLYSAVTLAAQQLGFLDEWLDATARSKTPVAAFSSLFPFQGDTLFAPPPATLWPPPPSQVTSPSPLFLAKMRWEVAHLLPLSLIESLVLGQNILADQWAVDAESKCLLRRDRPSQSPFRFVRRSRVPVDRLTNVSQSPNSAACVEFEAGAGLWTVIRFADTEAEQAWSSRIESCFRLLADTGFGGRRSAGWGQTAEPEWQSGAWPGILLPKVARNAASDHEKSSLYWLLSLYAPGVADKVNWKSGSYQLAQRGGRVQSLAGSGALKKTVRLVQEGSVLSASASPIGSAVDVAPDGFAHPVYRSGFALALQLPIVRQKPIEAVEETPTEGVIEASREAEQPPTDAEVGSEPEIASKETSTSTISAEEVGELEPAIEPASEVNLAAEPQDEEMPAPEPAVEVKPAAESPALEPSEDELPPLPASEAEIQKELEESERQDNEL